MFIAFFFHPQMLGTLQKYAGFIDSASVLHIAPRPTALII